MPLNTVFLRKAFLETREKRLYKIIGKIKLVSYKVTIMFMFNSCQFEKGTLKLE